MNKLTIYDIANEAGVSITTVSRVLNGKGNLLKDTTRKKVEKVLKSNNYMPNLAARGLASKTMNTIGVLIVDIRDDHHAHSAYTIEREFSKLGYSCVMFNTGHFEKTKEYYIRMLAERQVDGAILIGSVFQDPAIEECISRYLPNVPFVIANGYLPLPNVCGILCDDTRGVEMAVGELAGRGHRYIAYMQDLNTISALKKVVGFHNGMNKIGIEEEEHLLMTCENSFVGGYTGTEEMMKLNPNITAIVYGEDITAVGGMKALSKMGYNVPEDIEVIGFNNSIYARICTPTLTSVDNKLSLMAKKATQTLYEMIRGENISAKIIVMPELVYRESTREQVKMEVV
jgi:LacI family transcriptional regulator